VILLVTAVLIWARHEWSGRTLCREGRDISGLSGVATAFRGSATMRAADGSRLPRRSIDKPVSSWWCYFRVLFLGDG